MHGLEEKLGSIHAELTEQIRLVDSMVQSAYRSMRERCIGTAEEVRRMERIINAREIQIEESCLTVLALQQPVASDLRRIAAAIKINSELERIADLALNLTERSESLLDHPDVDVPSTITQMIRFALEMLGNAGKSYTQEDSSLARFVCESDTTLDEMNRDLIASLLSSIETDPSNASAYLHIFSASRIIERIGDLATNIAEDVEYMVEGEITRHGQLAG
ncbi:MAG: phosphate signaling complex protein PhoU [Planctomycetota bacterium]